MTTAPGGGARNNSTSLRRALGILLRLGENTGATSGASLGDLAQQLSLSKSTVLRLLAPLVETGFVVRDDRAMVYRLGPRNAQLGQAYLAHLDLRGVARPALTALVDQTGETAHLVIADLPDVIYIDKVDSPHSVRMHSRIGHRMPAYCTAVGKAILAHADDETFNAVVAVGMASRTPTTRGTPQDLRADLATVRKLGYAVDDGENETGIRCVSAPVFDDVGQVTSAISISGPENRITPQSEAKLGALVQACAQTISRELGAYR
ncbi:MAG: IclR family transcriptional regulator [Actinomycetota bacterium]|nr:IclR family transcriptional regulator [Actinomycetota bacterium]